MRSSTLDTLTGDQKDQLYGWLLEMPVSQVVRKLAQPAPEGFGIKTHITTLQRFKDRRWAEQADAQIEAAKIASARSAADATLDVAIASTLKRHLFARASSPDATTADLALLARFVHRNEKLKLEVERVQISRERLAQNNRRLDLLDRSVKVREETLNFRREESARRASNSKLKTENSKLSSQSDELGPFASDLEGIRERARKHFGITPEESARRAELRRTWKNPNDYLNAPHPQPAADHVAAPSSSCAAQAHEESSVAISAGVTATVSPSLPPSADDSFDSNHGSSSKQEPAPVRDIPVLETNNPTGSNPASPLAALAAHNAQFFKAIGAQAAAALNALNARTHSKPESENLNREAPTRAAAHPMLIAENPSPEGTLDNSPALAMNQNLRPEGTFDNSPAPAMNQNRRPEGTFDNSPAPSVPGNSATLFSVPQGRLNSTAFQPAPNQSTESNQ